MALADGTVALRMPLRATSTTTMRPASGVTDTLGSLLGTDFERPTEHGPADLARQLLSPIEVASGYADALGRDSLAMNSGQARVDTLRIQASCRQTKSMLDGLLTIVRLQQQGPRSRRSIVDTCRLLHETARRNAPLLLDKGLSFSAETHEIALARLDRDAVHSIVDNLLATLVPRARCGSQLWAAIERGPSVLTLRIYVEPTRDVNGATVGVQDAIPSLPEATRGLPFVIASRIVELLGGRIELEEGQSGRAWRVRLPV